MNVPLFETLAHTSPWFYRGYIEIRIYVTCQSLFNNAALVVWDFIYNFVV